MVPGERSIFPEMYFLVTQYTRSDRLDVGYSDLESRRSQVLESERELYKDGYCVPKTIAVA